LTLPIISEIKFTSQILLGTARQSKNHSVWYDSYFQRLNQVFWTECKVNWG